MKEIKFESNFLVYTSVEELPVNIKSLMKEAIEAREKAYAPYSNFFVGAAVLLDNGEVVTGNNQENASYPSGLCAERTAIYFAGSKYPEAKILSIAITASSQNQETSTPIPPCGACRQAISEYEVKQNSPIEIYFMGKTGEIIKSESLANLLPFVFKKSSL
jgi:cytidine deaminase